MPSTNRLIPLGNREYKREHQDINTGAFTRVEFLQLKSGTFRPHNLNGPAIIDCVNNRMYGFINGVAIPNWVPVSYEGGFIITDRDGKPIETVLDKALVLKVVLDFDREYGNHLNKILKKG